MRRFFFRSGGPAWSVHLREELEAWCREPTTPQQPTAREEPEGRGPDAADVALCAALRWRMELERRRDVDEVEESRRRLKARERCDAFALAVHRAAGEVGGEGACEMAARLLEVARSAYIYVAEGCGRRARCDSLFFLRRAEALLEEAAYLLDTASRFACLSHEAAQELLALHLDAIRALDVLIAWLERDTTEANRRHAFA